MGMPGKTKNMRRYYEQSEWIEQKWRGKKAGWLLMVLLFGIAASMTALYAFLLFALVSS